MFNFHVDSWYPSFPFGWLIIDDWDKMLKFNQPIHIHNWILYSLTHYSRRQHRQNEIWTKEKKIMQIESSYIKLLLLLVCDCVTVWVFMMDICKTIGNVNGETKPKHWIIGSVNVEWMEAIIQPVRLISNFFVFLISFHFISFLFPFLHINIHTLQHTRNVRNARKKFNLSKYRAVNI